MDKLIKHTLIAIFWLLVLAGLICLTAVAISNTITQLLNVMALLLVLLLDMVAAIFFIISLENALESGDQLKN